MPRAACSHTNSPTSCSNNGTARACRRRTPPQVAHSRQRHFARRLSSECPLLAAPRSRGSRLSTQAIPHRQAPSRALAPRHLHQELRLQLRAPRLHPVWWLERMGPPRGAATLQLLRVRLRQQEHLPSLVDLLRQCLHPLNWRLDDPHRQLQQKRLPAPTRARWTIPVGQLSRRQRHVFSDVPPVAHL